MKVRCRALAAQGLLIACSSSPTGLGGVSSAGAGAPGVPGGIGSSAAAAGAAMGGAGAAAGSNEALVASGAGGVGAAIGAASSTSPGAAHRPFPQHQDGSFCVYPTLRDDATVQSAYQVWKSTTVTSDGAGGFLRVKKPDSGAVIGSTASEGIGYGMILSVYMGDEPLFDALWRYEQLHLDSQGLMNWDITPAGGISSDGQGSATDGDVDMAWALVMADRQWGGQGTLDKPYLGISQDLIGRIWVSEVDHGRTEMLKPGDQWGDVDITNPSYFAPGYFRAFGSVTNQVANWNKVIDANYAILSRSLSAANGNAKNGLVPAWCNEAGNPVIAFAGAATNFQNDATRVPFRVGQDYCYTGEPRAKAYLALIDDFYGGVGVANIVDGYDLNGTPHPETASAGLQAASFVGPAGVAAMSDAKNQAFVDQAYAAVATQKLTAGTIYYQKSWTALSLLMMTGNLVDLSAP